MVEDETGPEPIDWNQQLATVDMSYALAFLDQVETALAYFFEVVIPLSLLVDIRRLDEITTTYPDPVMNSKPRSSMQAA